MGRRDRIDRDILALLQTDASLSTGEIADRVSISKTACWRRIQQLDKEGIIQKRVALLNAAAVGLPLTVYISVRTNQHNDRWAGQFLQTVRDLPEVLEVHRMSGDLDYLIKAVVSDMPGYDRLYKKLIKADLSDVSASFVMEEMKYTTELPLDSF
ncbi:Lrp/AsnC family transcriptional regulator [Oceanospirillum sediminis]|uniref:Lrp/AsnC family transcriptional regulator n=1 Tax=Oceanospirillum sediminis TaxID=2760088 RepID=A0A839IM73_9GAMM|nr:Lrp/AsnC family transcriptional regulator [Oceanospirillum sediminis]MBB1485567.1 Lrp/AsnC family transcriptional regulator [Oceanospirillum sediminis]